MKFYLTRALYLIGALKKIKKKGEKNQFSPYNNSGLYKAELFVCSSFHQH